MHTNLWFVSTVLVALALAPASHGQTMEATQVKLKWYACPFQTAEDPTKDDPNATPAECADVALPLCYPGVCTSTKTISVFVKRLLAAKPPADNQARALWMVQGGPGFGSPSLEPGLLDAYKAFNGTLSVYTIDHRGTGRSTILNCTASASSNLNQWQALAQCHRDLKSIYGEGGSAGFSVTSAASDLATLIQTPSLFDGTDVFVYGISYGTYTAARLMHLQPSNVKGYVLDSIQSEEFGTTKDAPYYSNWDRDVGDAVDQYFLHCDNDSFCSSKLGRPSSKQALVDVYAALESGASPCVEVLATKANASNIATPAQYVGTTLNTMLGDKSTWSLIAPFIFRLRRCSQDDLDMFGMMDIPDDDAMAKLFLPPKVGRSAYLKDEGFSSILYNTVVFSELWERPSPTIEKMGNDAKNALFGSRNADWLRYTFQEYCVYVDNKDPVCQSYAEYPGAGFAYPRDAYWNKTAPIPAGASAMLLSGLMDPATPPKYARDQLNNMQGTEKLLLEFPFGGHGTLSTTPLADQPNVDCANQIFYQYIRNRGKLQGLDTSCVAKVQTLDFKKILNSDRAMAIFGTAGDVWGPDAPPLPTLQPSPTPPAKSPNPSPSLSPNPSSSARINDAVSGVVILLVALEQLGFDLQSWH